MELVNTDLALPLAGTLLLTLLVWIFLFVQRLSYMHAHKLDANKMKSPEEVKAMIPPEASTGNSNFQNLLEVPVIFYVACLYLMVSGQVDSLYVNCAWVFLVGRIAHSLIHCSYNNVNHRFAAYLVSSVAVWVMVVRAFLAAV